MTTTILTETTIPIEREKRQQVEKDYETATTTTIKATDHRKQPQIITTAAAATRGLSVTLATNVNGNKNSPNQKNAHQEQQQHQKNATDGAAITTTKQTSQSKNTTQSNARNNSRHNDYVDHFNHNHHNHNQKQQQQQQQQSRSNQMVKLPRDRWPKLAATTNSSLNSNDSETNIDDNRNENLQISTSNKNNNNTENSSREDYIIKEKLNYNKQLEQTTLIHTDKLNTTSPLLYIHNSAAADNQAAESSFSPSKVSILSASYPHRTKLSSIIETNLINKQKMSTLANLKNINQEEESLLPNSQSSTESEKITIPLASSSLLDASENGETLKKIVPRLVIQNLEVTSSSVILTWNLELYQHLQNSLAITNQSLLLSNNNKDDSLLIEKGPNIENNRVLLKDDELITNDSELIKIDRNKSTTTTTSIDYNKEQKIHNNNKSEDESNKRTKRDTLKQQQQQQHQHDREDKSLKNKKSLSLSSTKISSTLDNIEELNDELIDNNNDNNSKGKENKKEEIPLLNNKDKTNDEIIKRNDSHYGIRNGNTNHNLNQDNLTVNNRLKLSKIQSLPASQNKRPPERVSQQQQQQQQRSINNEDIPLIDKTTTITPLTNESEDLNDDDDLGDHDDNDDIDSNKQIQTTTTSTTTTSSPSLKSINNINSTKVPNTLRNNNNNNRSRKSNSRIVGTLNDPPMVKIPSIPLNRLQTATSTTSTSTTTSTTKKPTLAIRRDPKSLSELILNSSDFNNDNDESSSTTTTSTTTTTTPMPSTTEISTTTTISPKSNFSNDKLKDDVNTTSSSISEFTTNSVKVINPPLSLSTTTTTNTNLIKKPKLLSTNNEYPKVSKWFVKLRKFGSNEVDIVKIITNSSNINYNGLFSQQNKQPILRHIKFKNLEPSTAYEICIESGNNFNQQQQQQHLNQQSVGDLFQILDANHLLKCYDNIDNNISQNEMQKNFTFNNNGTEESSQTRTTKSLCKEFFTLAINSPIEKLNFGSMADNNNDNKTLQLINSAAANNNNLRKPKSLSNVLKSRIEIMELNEPFLLNSNKSDTTNNNNNNKIWFEMLASSAPSTISTNKNNNNNQINRLSSFETDNNNINYMMPKNPLLNYNNNFDSNINDHNSSSNKNYQYLNSMSILPIIACVFGLILILTLANIILNAITCRTRSSRRTIPTTINGRLSRNKKHAIGEYINNNNNNRQTLGSSFYSGADNSLNACDDNIDSYQNRTLSKSSKIVVVGKNGDPFAATASAYFSECPPPTTTTTKENNKNLNKDYNSSINFTSSSAGSGEGKHSSTINLLASSARFPLGPSFEGDEKHNADMVGLARKNYDNFINNIYGGGGGGGSGDAGSRNSANAIAKISSSDNLDYHDNNNLFSINSSVVSLAENKTIDKSRGSNHKHRHHHHQNHNHNHNHKRYSRDNAKNHYDNNREREEDEVTNHNINYNNIVSNENNNEKDFRQEKRQRIKFDKINPIYNMDSLYTIGTTTTTISSSSSSSSSTSTLKSSANHINKQQKLRKNNNKISKLSTFKQQSLDNNDKISRPSSCSQLSLNSPSSCRFDNMDKENDLNCCPACELEKKQQQQQQQQIEQNQFVNNEVDDNHDEDLMVECDGENCDDGSFYTCCLDRQKQRFYKQQQQLERVMTKNGSLIPQPFISPTGPTGCDLFLDNNNDNDVNNLIDKSSQNINDENKKSDCLTKQSEQDDFEKEFNDGKQNDKEQQEIIELNDNKTKIEQQIESSNFKTNDDSGEKNHDNYNKEPEIIKSVSSALQSATPPPAPPPPPPFSAQPITSKLLLESKTSHYLSQIQANKNNEYLNDNKKHIKTLPPKVSGIQNNSIEQLDVVGKSFTDDRKIKIGQTKNKLIVDIKPMKSSSPTMISNGIDDNSSETINKEDFNHRRNELANKLNLVGITKKQINGK